MTTSAPQAASADLVPAAAPNVFHLHGGGVHITYFPDGSGPLTVDGAVKLIYRDAHTAATFRADEVDVKDVAALGSVVSVVLHNTFDLGSTTATVLIPDVVLEGAQSVPVHSVLITSVHSSPLTGIGSPQRDDYTVANLVGNASHVILPL